MEDEGLSRGEFGMGWHEGNVRAIVSTVSSEVELPCRRMRVTVPSVDGLHVMLYGVPAVMVDRVVMVNAF